MAKRAKMVTGMETVRKAFGNLPEVMLIELTDALNRGVMEIAEAARTLVPDQSPEIGIKEDIGTTIRTSKAGVVAIAFVGTNPRDAQVARLVEFGRHAGPGEHKSSPPRSFMWTAFWSKRKRVKGRVDRAVKKAAKMVATRGR